MVEQIQKISSFVFTWLIFVGSITNRVQLSLNLTHACKTSKTGVSTHFAHNFSMHTQSSEHTWYTKDARTVRRHVICSHLVCHAVATNTVTVVVSNEMQLFCRLFASLYVVMSIAWKSYWLYQICQDIFVSLVNKIEYCTA